MFYFRCHLWILFFKLLIWYPSLGSNLIDPLYFLFFMKLWFPNNLCQQTILLSINSLNPTSLSYIPLNLHLKLLNIFHLNEWSTAYLIRVFNLLLRKIQTHSGERLSCIMIQSFVNFKCVTWFQCSFLQYFLVVLVIWYKNFRLCYKEPCFSCCALRNPQIINRNWSLLKNLFCFLKIFYCMNKILFMIRN